MNSATLEKRLASVETQIKENPQYSITQWFLKGLAKAESKATAEEGESALSGGYFLALNEVIDKPAESVWERVVARMNEPKEDWSGLRWWFAYIYVYVCDADKIKSAAQICEDLAEANAKENRGDNSEGLTEDVIKDLFCVLAINYFDLFQDAPHNGDERAQVLRFDDLNLIFLAPLLCGACPELSKYSHATYKDWLEGKCKEARAYKQQTGKMKSHDNTELLEDLRAYVAAIPQTRSG